MKKRKMTKAKRRKLSKVKEFTTLDFIKANRVGSKQAEQECEHGFTSKHKVHKSKKTYSRKGNKKYV